MSISRRSFLAQMSAAAGALALHAAPARAQRTKQPNILIAIADDASYPHMGAYGCDWVTTPAFDRVAREGLLFTRAYTPNAKCAPCRACILTGRNSWQLEEAANHWPVFPTKFKVYPEVFAENGYHVGATGKGWAPGISQTEDGKPRHLAGQPYNERQTEPPAQHISGNDYAANFQDFLGAKPEEAPFCFWYGGFEPHRAYEFDAGVKKGGKDISEIDHVPGFWPDNQTIRKDMLDYAFEIEYFDQHLARMLDALDAQGELENTLVLVTADNGMPFPRIKGQAYELSNHLPLAIMWPGQIAQPGRTVEDFVSFIDFAPTFMQAAGIDWESSGMAPSPGKPLQSVFRNENASPHRSHILIGKERHDIGRPHDWGYPIRGIVNEEWLYLRNFEPERWPAGNPETGYLNTDGSPTKTQVLDMAREGVDVRYWRENFGKRPPEELYHVLSDPDCLNNLAEAPSMAETKRMLRTQMENELREQQDPRILGRGEVFDDYPYAHKNSQGFYERYMQDQDKSGTGWVNPSDFEEGPVDYSLP